MLKKVMGIGYLIIVIGCLMALSGSVSGQDLPINISNKTNCTTCPESINVSSTAAVVEEGADEVAINDSAEPAETEAASQNATSDNATAESLASAASANATEQAESINVSSTAAAVVEEGADEVAINDSAEPAETEAASQNATSDNATAESLAPAASANATEQAESINVSSTAAAVVEEGADEVAINDSAEPAETEAASQNTTSDNATVESLAPAASANATEQAENINVSSTAAVVVEEGADEVAINDSAEPAETEAASQNATSDNAVVESVVPAASANASQEASLNNSVTITVIDDETENITANESAETSEADITAALDTAVEAEIVQESPTNISTESNCTTCGEGVSNSVTIEVLDEAADNATMNQSAEAQEDSITSAIETEAQQGNASCYLIQDVSSLGNNTSSEACINCAEPTNESVVIRGQQTPTCAISASSSVCEGSTGNIASVVYQVGATYQWRITNGMITSSANSPQIVYTAGNIGSPVVLSVSVTKTYGAASSTAVCTCTNSINIPVTANNGCNIVAPASVCAGSRGNTASVPAQTGARYIWNITNGMITSGQYKNQIGWTAGDAASPTRISVTVERTLGYGGKVCVCSGSFDVQVRPNPICVITSPLNVCKGSVGNKASVPDAGPGAEYVWTISNGTITAGQGTREITWNAGQTTPVTITVNVKTRYNCTCT